MRSISLRLRPSLALTLTVVLHVVVTSGCYTYQPAPVYAPSKFDRSWAAAQGAAADCGVAVTTADRSTGTIRGTAAGNDVGINVWSQADGGVRVEINVTPLAVGADPQLNQRLTAAYQRRMGR